MNVGEGQDGGYMYSDAFMMNGVRSDTYSAYVAGKVGPDLKVLDHAQVDFALGTSAKKSFQ